MDLGTGEGHRNGFGEQEQGQAQGWIWGAGTGPEMAAGSGEQVRDWLMILEAFSSLRNSGIFV